MNHTRRPLPGHAGGASCRPGTRTWLDRQGRTGRTAYLVTQEGNASGSLLADHPTVRTARPIAAVQLIHQGRKLIGIADDVIRPSAQLTEDGAAADRQTHFRRGIPVTARAAVAGSLPAARRPPLLNYQPRQRDGQARTVADAQEPRHDVSRPAHHVRSCESSCGPCCRHTARDLMLHHSAIARLGDHGCLAGDAATAGALERGSPSAPGPGPVTTARTATGLAVPVPQPTAGIRGTAAAPSPG